jgi:hypothetical protein
MSAAYTSNFAVVSYICTHKRKMISLDTNKSEPYHTIYDMPWVAYCNIIGADTWQEKQILLNELKRTRGQSKIIDLGDRYAYIPPFEIMFFSKEKTEMTLQEMQRLHNLGQMPIETINIKFLKILYNRLVRQPC